MSVNIYGSRVCTGSKKEFSNVSVLSGNINDGRDSSRWNYMSFIHLTISG